MTLTIDSNAQSLFSCKAPLGVWGLAVWVFWFLLLAAPLALQAQPTLPALAGNSSNGAITLSWTCQYNSVKAISVLRAKDSLADFAIIGYVKNTGKGIQSFTDPHPLPARNCYKLAIEFRSGLIWRSNNYCIEYGKTPLESDLLPARKATVTMSDKPSSPDIAPVPPAPAPEKPKAQPMSIPGDTSRTSTPYRSMCVTTAASGNVILNLPDANSHHYAIRFMDVSGHVISEVPKIVSNTIVFDSRNFQGLRLIKFVLYKNGTELEGGYLKPVAH